MRRMPLLPAKRALERGYTNLALVFSLVVDRSLIVSPSRGRLRSGMHVGRVRPAAHSRPRGGVRCQCVYVGKHAATQAIEDYGVVYRKSGD